MQLTRSSCVQRPKHKAPNGVVTLTGRNGALRRNMKTATLIYFPGELFRYKGYPGLIRCRNNDISTSIKLQLFGTPAVPVSNSEVLPTIHVHIYHYFPQYCQYTSR
jgi:hypothetical protein